MKTAVPLSSLLLTWVGTLQADDTNGIRRSDVVFATQATPEVYQQYRATMLAWGFRPWKLSGKEFYAEWKRGVDETHRAGLRYQARVELDAGWRGMIDFDPTFQKSACLDLEGNPIIYRFWNSQYKGHPPYYFCTNSPSYRKYLIQQAREALAGNPDMLLIDGIHTTANALHQGGCFCPHRMAGFRNYLASHLSQQTLDDLLIEDLNDFDYRQFLSSKNIPLKEFGKQLLAWPSQVPLAEEYLTFQQQAAREFLAEFHQAVDEISAKPIEFSTSTPLQHARDWYPSSVIDHFTIETILHPEKKQLSDDQIFRFKLADGLDKRILVTGMGHNDWTYVRDHNLKGMVRHWIAQSYAYGHNFPVPHHVWAGEGEARYESKPGDYDHLYHFVRKHADLLDGYEPVAKVGLLYSHTAMRRWKPQSKRIALELTKKNIPFRFVVAGDDWLDQKLSPEDLHGLNALITPKPIFLDKTQQAGLDTVADLTVNWPDEKQLLNLVPQQIRLEGTTKLAVLPRANSATKSAPCVCHLLNNNYDADQDAMIPTGELTLSLANSLFGRELKTATLLLPGQPDRECKITRGKEGITITIPSIDLWGLLKLE